MRRKTLIICVAVIFFLIIFSCILFAPAIFQEGNPLPILQGIIKLQLSDEKMVLMSNNPEKYITKTKGGYDTLIQFMKNNGWSLEDQLGAGYIFEKQGNSITIECRQYSKHFKLWKIPNLKQSEQSYHISPEDKKVVGFAGRD